MKVWVVVQIYDYGESFDIDKVFDSKEKAEKYVKKNENKQGIDQLTMFSGMVIEECEVE